MVLADSEIYPLMSAFNILHTLLTCPHCQITSQMQVELFFGFRYQLEYCLGERYLWVARKQVQNGGRPENGNMVGEGYTECPNCHYDFFVEVVVIEDVLTEAKPSTTKHGYIK